MARTAMRNLLVAGLVALVVPAILLPFALSRPDPGAVFAAFLFGPLTSVRHLGNVVEAATPIALTGVAASFAIRAGTFNLGMEGAAFLGGLGATAAALLVPLPGAVAPLACIGAGALLGSLACVLPAYLRMRHDASEMVTSLILNYAVLFAGLFVLNHVLRDPASGALASYRIPLEARLPRLLAGTRINVGAIVAALVCLVAGVVLFRTRAGLNLRIVGSSPGFAAHLGLPAARIAFVAQAVAGLAAGAAGAIEILGLYPRFTWTHLPGLGWSGVTVAILARENPMRCFRRPCSSATSKSEATSSRRRLELRPRW